MERTRTAGGPVPGTKRRETLSPTMLAQLAISSTGGVASRVDPGDGFLRWHQPRSEDASWEPFQLRECPHTFRGQSKSHQPRDTSRRRTAAAEREHRRSRCPKARRSCTDNGRSQEPSAGWGILRSRSSPSPAQPPHRHGGTAAWPPSAAATCCKLFETISSNQTRPLSLFVMSKVTLSAPTQVRRDFRPRR